MKEENKLRRPYSICYKMLEIWIWQFPELRFGQFISNLFTKMENEGIDPFYIEDDKMVDYLCNYETELRKAKILAEKEREK